MKTPPNTSWVSKEQCKEYFLQNSLDKHNKIIIIRERETFEQITVNVQTVNDTSFKQFSYLSVGSLQLKILASKLHRSPFLVTVIYG
jgi:hypothetical protein